MPNHVWNVLTIHGKKRDVDAFIKKAKGKYPTGHAGDGQDELLSCHAFVPMPQAIADTPSPNNDKNKEKLRHVYGYDNWYDWCCAKWGTKWGCYETTLRLTKRGVTYTFDTAWGPADEALFAMIKQHPTLRFSLWYREGAMGFQGRIVGINGDVTTNSHENYRGQMGG